MEIANPIFDILDIVDEWKGKIQRNDEEQEAIFSLDMYGKDIIQYDLKITQKKEKKIIEKGYFFFDKIKEQLVHLLLSEEGYIEINSLTIIKKGNSITLKSVFTKGYNLPPNMRIIRLIEFSRKRNTVELTHKLGKEEEVFSKGIFSRTS